MAELWERNEEESEKAFVAFRAYRDMGIGKRSINRAAQEILQTDYSEHQAKAWRAWSSKYGWVKRVRAWDAELDRERLEKEKVELEEMRQRHLTEARGLQSLGISGLAKLQRKIRENPDYEMSAGLVMQLMVQGSNMERLARGEPTEIAKSLGVKQVIELRWQDDDPATDPDPDALAASDAEPDQEEPG